MIKPKSFSSIYKSCHKYVPQRDLNGKHEVLSTVKVDFEGRSVSQSKYVTDDPASRYDGMKPSDFALENQLAVGVQPHLAKCSLQVNEIDREIERVNNLNFTNDGN